MNNTNNKSPKNKEIIDISLNIIQNPNKYKDNINAVNITLHTDVEETIEDLLYEICNEVDNILEITREKCNIIDQSYNLLFASHNTEHSFSDNIKHKNNNYFMRNNTLSNDLQSNDNGSNRSISYYLNSYNYNYHKQRNRDSNRSLTNTLLDINKHCDDFNLKRYIFPNTISNIPIPINIKKRKVDIKVSLNSINDLIKLTEDYPLSPNIEYNIDMKAIHLIKPDIVRLDNMIGMHNLKENILDQILYFIQKLHVHKNENINNEFMHTVIYGPPGTGKTETAHIIGGIYSKLGILKNNVFKKVTRTELIAGYLGQTAIKTTEVIKSAIGGVLFIDEAYALGNSEKKDSFAKECIDTLCESLSNHKHELMVIIAGYEEDLKKCFFSYNQGLDSRFIWRFKIEDYTSKELQLIFNKKVNDCGWTISTIPNSWFKKHMGYFKYFGRDMETLLSKVKIAHSRRVFCLHEDEKRKINLKDIDKGFKLYLKNDEVKSRMENRDNPLVNMYL